ncbi:aromatic aminotransferase ISS1-like isoform X2 [Phragmites australis]|uniref:aromatic aminotransferase ISS1-like isoform X2 n=1 Tax=Phragmites australis TaxID=29695 RepID=UPI002D79A7F5|nr:aromatic aminotransferase ISS1-like isoform X2 [Phragmites australis]
MLLLFTETCGSGGRGLVRELGIILGPRRAAGSRRRRRGGDMGSFAKLARRAVETDAPVMVKIQELLRGATDVMSLAQGVVYWQPPESALNKVKEFIWEPSVSRYGSDDGLPELREALLEKLRRENKLTKSSVMVTAGANQAFVNLVLTLCDAGDSVVMFAPYYFNAYMSFQMTGVTDILVGASDPKTLHPDVDWLEKVLKEHDPIPKVVTVVNPGNPSGAFIPRPMLERISDLCKKAGAWLLVDNTYEYFMYDGMEHYCLEDNHIVNLFSFSKAYGMMGWRVGYIAHPNDADGFHDQLLKVQDNIPICASIVGQYLALYSLEAGPEWIKERVKDLVKNRELLVEALSPLGEDSVKGGEGAIYLWAKLPDNNSDDFEVVRWLANKHGVAVIPGSASGGPGYIRVSFGGLKEEDTRLAAERLKCGLQELVTDGMVQ